jgi:hypothetical protein
MTEDDRLAKIEKVRLSLDDLAAWAKISPERVDAVIHDRDEVVELLVRIFNMVAHHRYYTQDDFLVSSLRAHRALIENWPGENKPRTSDFDPMLRGGAGHRDAVNSEGVNKQATRRLPMKTFLLTGAAVIALTSSALACATLDGENCQTEISRAEASHAPADQIVVVGTFGKSDIPNIVAASKDNEFKFNRDFRGKRFEATLS